MLWVVADPPPKLPTPEALRSISAAIEAQPHLPTLRAFRAGMMTRLGRPEDAIADFAAAIDLDPRGPDYTTQIATCHLRAGRPETALEVCDSRVRRVQSRMEPSARSCAAAVGPYSGGASRADARVAGCPPMSGRSTHSAKREQSRPARRPPAPNYLTPGPPESRHFSV